MGSIPLLSLPSYINREEIDFYYQSFNLKAHLKNTHSTTVEVSTTGGNMSKTFEQKESSISIIEKLFALMDFISKNDMVVFNRPNIISEAENLQEFVFETLVAEKIYFPQKALTELSTIKELTVWVSNPLTEKLDEDPFVQSGTFLYLIETIYDKAEFNTTISGCSALQALSNIVNGRNFYQINLNETMGRLNSAHPIEKLKSIGGVALGKQNIRTLYRKRYFTDEQSFLFNNVEYRCNDLLGYPLFIESE